MNKKIMAIGAHADDVELHFGGTLFKYMDRGYEIVYVMSTNNMSGSKRVLQPDGSHLKSDVFYVAETMAYRKQEAADAAKLFNTAPIHLDHPQRHCHVRDGRGGLRQMELRYGCELPEVVPGNVPSILTAFEDQASIDSLAGLILKHDPEVIFTHGLAEVNPEHHCTFLLVKNAYWKAEKQGYRGSLLMGVRGFAELGKFAGCWETWVDVTGFFDRRMAAVNKHVSQYPPEFKRGITHWREIYSKRGKICGVEAAEAFNFVNTPKAGQASGELTGELMRTRAEKSPWGPVETAT